MTLDEQNRLLEEIKRDEGYRLSAYQDSLGFWTIGYGRLIDERKGGHISVGEAEFLLANDVKRVEVELAPYAWFACQDTARQAALINMAFNLGVVGLFHFPKFLMHMGAKEYPEAVDQLKDTLWHKQVGARADWIIHTILTGEWA